MRPLDDLVVLDLTQFVAGPYCTMLLADAGARVIKIEPPGTGEPYRRVGPALERGGSGTGGYFLRMNRGKESLTLDLRNERGRDVLLQLAERADVLVENFKTDSMDRLDLGWERLHARNPALVYASVSGFGHRDHFPGPFAEWPAFAIVAEAMGGIMQRIGEADCEPHWSGVSLGDIFASVLAATGILTALHARDRSGEGQHVDISMYDGMISLNERAIYTYAATGKELERGTEPEFAPFGAFEARDGWVVVGVVTNDIWQRFCAALERPDLASDPRLATGQGRSLHLDGVIRPAIATWLAGRTRRQATEALVRHQVPAGLVQTAADILDCPQANGRDMVVEFDYPGAGPQKVAGNPIKLSGDLHQPVRRPPLLGEHTQGVLGELLGMSDADLEELRSAGVI
ncbi:MAG: CoA transferase [Candidatus Dormibacteraeota bacterium]|nr:CoA transferase [Candidatus Dormibacteraeota bacterium]MBO0762639.1 CoA transferase [Candidatus Dormibacteraeota bacterium]